MRDHTELYYLEAALDTRYLTLLRHTHPESYTILLVLKTSYELRATMEVQQAGPRSRNLG
jgi:hypothetical protein